MAVVRAHTVARPSPTVLSRRPLRCLHTGCDCWHVRRKSAATHATCTHATARPMCPHAGSSCAGIIDAAPPHKTALQTMKNVTHFSHALKLGSKTSSSLPGYFCVQLGKAVLVATRKGSANKVHTRPGCSPAALQQWSARAAVRYEAGPDVLAEPGSGPNVPVLVNSGGRRVTWDAQVSRRRK